MRFGVHYDLSPVIDDGESVVALNHAAGRSHLRAFGIGQIALLLVAGRATLLLVVFQEGFDLGDLSPIVLCLLGLAARASAFALLPITLPVSLDNPLGNSLQLLALLLEFLVGAAPLLGGIRGQFAAIDREVFLADQAQPRGIEQHVAEQARDLLLQAADESGNGREVRSGIG